MVDGFRVADLFTRCDVGGGNAWIAGLLGRVFAEVVGLFLFGGQADVVGSFQEDARGLALDDLSEGVDHLSAGHGFFLLFLLLVAGALSLPLAFALRAGLVVVGAVGALLVGAVLAWALILALTLALALLAGSLLGALLARALLLAFFLAGFALFAAWALLCAGLALALWLTATAAVGVAAAAAAFAFVESAALAAASAIASAAAASAITTAAASATAGATVARVVFGA